jgi:hypothetical protein
MGMKAGQRSDGLTLKDFLISREEGEGYKVPFVPWENIREVLEADQEGAYGVFEEWMRGQTCLLGGPYPWDLELFLKHYNKGQRAPIYD